MASLRFICSFLIAASEKTVPAVSTVRLPAHLVDHLRNPVLSHLPERECCTGSYDLIIAVKALPERPGRGFANPAERERDKTPEFTVIG